MVSHEKSPYERMCENWRTELKIQNSKNGHKFSFCIIFYNLLQFSLL